MLIASRLDCGTPDRRTTNDNARAEARAFAEVEARGLEPLTSSMPWMRSTKTELCPR